MEQLDEKVLRELRHAGARPPLLCFNLTATWNTDVCCYDASNTEFAVCRRKATTDEIRPIGVSSEKWRFAATELMRARESALRDTERMSRVERVSL